MNHIIRIILLTASSIIVLSSFAANIEFKPRSQSISLIGAIGSSANIFDILKQKKLLTPHSYLFGGGYRTYALTNFIPVKINIELFKHFKRQQSYEMTFYPSLESPTIYLYNIGLYASIGDGISVLFGSKPKFEHSKYLHGKYQRSENIKARRLLNFLALEQNIFFKEFQQYQLTLKWHHRCNLFGRMAPRNTGANFFGLGMRFEF